MRAYLINPVKRAITEVDLDDLDINELFGVDDNSGHALGSGALLPDDEADGDGDWLSDWLYVPEAFSFEQGVVPDIKGDPRDWFHIEGSTVTPGEPATFPFPWRGTSTLEKVR